MLFWHELVHVVCVGAGVAVFAVLVHDNIPAHLGLLHLLDFLVELESLLPIHESFLHGRPGGLPGEGGGAVVEVIVVLIGRVAGVKFLETEWLCLVVSVYCGLIIVHDRALRVAESWEGLECIGVVVLNDFDIRVAVGVAVVGCGGLGGSRRYEEVVSVHFLTLVQVENQSAILFLVLNRYLIFVKM